LKNPKRGAPIGSIMNASITRQPLLADAEIAGGGNELLIIERGEGSLIKAPLTLPC
jgi:hypothetical protein